MQQEGDSIDVCGPIVHDSCMGKTITIDEEAYKLLSSLKQGKRDSFSQIIHRIVPARNAGELMDYYDSRPLPYFDPDKLQRIKDERGRRSGGRK